MYKVPTIPRFAAMRKCCCRVAAFTINGEIDFCSLHAAASELLDILRDFVSDWPNINEATVNEAKRRITKAEGK
ncbi:MAG TPA: hypothetical protein VLG74_02850 [Blastocatellia bacterium]|nr:hypothetical protein [Blastocatellia bacterium]